MTDYGKELQRLNEMIIRLGDRVIDINGQDVKLSSYINNPEFIKNNLTNDKVKELELLCNTLYKFKAKMGMLGKGGISFQTLILDNTIVLSVDYNNLETIGTLNNIMVTLPIGCQRRLVKLEMLVKWLRKTMQSIDEQGLGSVTDEFVRNFYPNGRLMYTSPFEYYCDFIVNCTPEYSIPYLYTRCAKSVLVQILMQDKIDMNRLRNLANDVFGELKDITEYFYGTINIKDRAKDNFGMKESRSDAIFYDLRAIMYLRVMFDTMINGGILTVVRSIKDHSDEKPRYGISTSHNDEIGMLRVVEKIIGASFGVINGIFEKKLKHLGELNRADIKPLCDMVCGNVSVFTSSAGKDLDTDNYRQLSNSWRKVLEDL